MTKTRIAINGFGRIGRLTFRSLLNNPEVEVVAINDLTDNYTLEHLLKYDTAHGRFEKDVWANDNYMYVDKQAIAATAEPDPAKLPWKSLEVDVVLECTGRFRDAANLTKHLEAGASKVVLSAPAKGDIKTVVLGVNDDTLTASDSIVSNASCTTNCLAMMAKVLQDNFGIEKGWMTTTHAYTADQNIQDGPHKDWRRARAAAQNIVPTSTGAAKAIGLVIPELKGKLDGVAMRVPVINGSLTELNVVLNKSVSVDDINRVFLKASSTNLQNYLEFTDEPLVSSDIIGNPHSCIYDSMLTMTNGSFARVTGWYDNEFGYSNRLAELAVKVAQRAPAVHA
jgi:glyceraldehyde 3-phosphate dehydrogenase